MLRQRHAGPALVVGDVGYVAERILDGELALAVEPVADAVVDRGDPRAVRVDRADEAVQHQPALGDDHVVRVAAGAGDQLVVRHHEGVFAAPGVDDRSRADGPDGVRAVAKVDREVDDVAFDVVVAVTEIDFLEGLVVRCVQYYAVVSGIGE